MLRPASVRPVAVGGIPPHVVLTSVVFDELRLVYVPMPKSASTSILGALAELAGIGLHDRVRSRKPEATRQQVIHDGSMWKPAHRLNSRSAEDVDWILRSDEWFRFTVVREPVRRLWSAWITKVLVRDPRFALMFGDDWFPDRPSSATDVVQSFRDFVTALPERPDWSDTHWSSQADLAGDIRYDHVGRVESLDETAAVVGKFLRHRNQKLPPFPTENPSFVPFDLGVFDRRAHEAAARYTARDRDAFGYAPPAYSAGSLDDEWLSSVEASIPALQAVIARNERLLDLWRLHADRQPAEGRRHRALVALGVAGTVSAATIVAAARHA
jgi:hypothetical protein